MAYEYKNNEIENDKLLNEIKSKLNASSSNFLDVQLINEITNDLWNKTNRNENRCVSIINKLSSRIKKTQDFKLKSKVFLEKLVQTKKHLNTSIKKESENQTVKTEEENDLFKLFLNLIKNNIEISAFLFGITFLLIIISIYNNYQKDFKIACSEITGTLLRDTYFKIDESKRVVYLRQKGQWVWFCNLNSKQNSCSAKQGLSAKKGSSDFSEYKPINKNTVLDLEEYSFSKFTKAFKDGTGRGYFYKCKKIDS